MHMCLIPGLQVGIRHINRGTEPGRGRRRFLKGFGDGVVLNGDRSRLQGQSQSDDSLQNPSSPNLGVQPAEAGSGTI